MAYADRSHDACFAGRRVLVTGGAGAIGSNLVAALVRAGAQVTVLDDLSAGAEWNLERNPPDAFVRGDVADETCLLRAFEARPAIVFHLAAFFANENSIDRPRRDLDTNGVGTLRVLEHCVRSDVERVVYASSSSVYGGEPPLPIAEDALAPMPRTPYQATKLLGELYCQVFHSAHGLPTVRARLFNSYGPGERPGRYRNVIPNFVFRALRGESIPVTGRGTDTRDFTYVGDVVAGLLRCAVAAGVEGRVFNLGSGRETSIRDLAERIVERSGSRSEIVTVPPRAWDARRRVRACIERARTELGFEATTPIDAGLDRTIEWFRQHWHRICETPIAATRRSVGVSSFTVD